jgi:hypothetical protein
MHFPHLSVLLVVFAAGCITTTARSQAADVGGLNDVCSLVEHERQRDLADSESNLELIENEYRPRGKVFEMLEKLWKTRSIEREAYLDCKRLLDPQSTLTLKRKATRMRKSLRSLT